MCISFLVIIIYLFIFNFTLQYCIGFAIHWHESAMGVHEFSILNPLSHHPPYIISLGYPSAPAPSILYPVLNLDWWFISYMIHFLHVSMPFSQIIPPSPSPTESKSLIYTSVSLLLSCIQSLITSLGSIVGQQAHKKMLYITNYSVSSVQSLSRVRLFETPWIIAHQASLSLTNS